MNAILELLKNALGEPYADSNRIAFLTSKIYLAKLLLVDNNVIDNKDIEQYGTEDKELISTYAEFLVNNRDTQNGLPDYLRWIFHNRIIQRGQSNV